MKNYVKDMARLISIARKIVRIRMITKKISDNLWLMY